MLWNKNWDKKDVKADPMSLANLIAWLEQQPRNKEYCYMSHGGCLLAQYLTFSFGRKALDVGALGFVFADDQMNPHPTPNSFQDIAAGKPYTFGAALARAREYL